MEGIMSKNGKYKKRIFSRGLTAICLGVFLYAGYGLFDILMDYYKNRQMMGDIQETFYQATSDNQANSNHGNDGLKSVRTGFEPLLEINQDIVGWITIDDTQINYPVLQSEDNIHYLDKNYEDNISRAGSIFLDYRNNISEPTRNTVVYGHRMKDGSMFQHLIKFLDEDFVENHPTFQFDTLYNSYEAEIFAVYNTLTDFNYIETNFENDQEYTELLDNIRNESRYDLDVQVDEDDDIITLSTCDYELDENNGRLVVQAKLNKI